jgi:hypothetical protein
MIIRLYGFDWIVYKERIMPALAAWLVDGDVEQAHQLFLHTRCSQEEQAMPAPLRLQATWPRSQTFVQRLPRSPHMLQEYALLCSAEQFTSVSDRYAHQHTPQLQQQAEALRTVWGALIETYCLPWSHQDEDEPEIVQLLTREAQILQQKIPEEVIIGRLPMTLHLRGWLASISIRAMALFEFLACGRRSMPFGYQPGYPFGSYVGYLTPDEVRQIALCLHHIDAPDQVEAEADQIRFQALQTHKLDTFHLIDEVLPTHAAPFLKATQLAAYQGWGLICSIG